MRCERCKFENIPGRDTCIKCGSALSIKPTAVDIYPPRMPKWEKPFRYFSRSIRKNRVIIYISTRLHTPEWLRDILSDNSLSLFLCLIPGLAHLINKRFKEIRLYFVAWLILLVAGLFLYGGLPGYICIGLAVGLHVGITIQYGLFKDLDNFREKTALAVLLLIGFIFIYYFIPSILFPVMGSQSTLTIPYYNISQGDYLLAGTNIDNETDLARGSLVLMHPVTVGGHGARATRNYGTVTGEIIGLPGENIRIVEDVFVVDGRQLHVEQYPVPGWLQKSRFSCIIPDNNYFISAQYNITAHGMNLTDSYIKQACIVPKSSIEAKVFMRWLPLAKRGFIK